MSRDHTARFPLGQTPHHPDFSRNGSLAEYESGSGSYEAMGPRVSDLLQPQSICDVGLQRALCKTRKKRHYGSRSVGMDKRETNEPSEGQQEQVRRVDSRLVPRQYERNYTEGVDYNNNGTNDRNGDSREFNYNVHSPRETLQPSNSMVDVVAAFGLPHSTVNRAPGKADVRTPPLAPSTIMESGELTLSRNKKALTPQTGPPHMEIGTATGVADHHWSSMSGTTGFYAIQPSMGSYNNSNSGDTGQYASPGAVSERIHYALPQQHGEQMVELSPPSVTAGGMANIQNKVQRSQKDLEKGGDPVMGEQRDSRAAPTLQHRPIQRVAPQESQVVDDIIRLKDREILQLRASLALSYRYAAYAAQGHPLPGTSNFSSSSPSPMGTRYMGALAGAVHGSAKDSSMLLVNRAPPHVHGIPDIPFPLELPSSVGRVCGLLSMMNVEDMLQKKTPTYTFSRSWHSYFVVADDRGLSIYRNEEDYEQHAFQRALLVVPFRDMVYFVPSFRDLPIHEDELLDDTESGGQKPSRTRGKHSGGNGGSSLLFSLIDKYRRPKGNKSSESKSSRAGIAGDYYGGSATDSKDDGDVSGGGGGGGEQRQERVRRKRFDHYEKLMASIAVEYIGDVNYAYFGFVARQPSAHVGSKVVNPPIVFRTRSAQEHAEWVHHFAQRFNRRLYREMFPMVLAESYAGTDSKETQTEIEIEATSTAVAGREREDKEQEQMNYLVATNLTAVSTMDAETQVSPKCSINVGRSCEVEEEEQEYEWKREVVSPFSASMPPPPNTSPPNWSVVESGEVQAVIHGIEAASQTNENGSFAISAVLEENTKKGKSVVKEEVLPWKELITELRELLTSKNKELTELQQDYGKLSQRAQRLQQELRQITNGRDELIKQINEDHARWEVEVERLRKREKDLHNAAEAARMAETAMQEASMREETQMAYTKSLLEEIEHLRQRQDILTAELLAVKDGYSVGLRSLAKKALGDIDKLHDVYTADEYLRALRGVTHGNSSDSRSTSNGSSVSAWGEHRSPEERERRYHYTRDGNKRSAGQRPQRHVQLPHSPPPRMSLRQIPVSPQRTQQQQQQGGKKRQRQCSSAGLQRRVIKKGTMCLNDGFVMKAPEVTASKKSNAVGIAMLLFSFTPQHMAIDGCFTVDEAQARLLRSGPSATQRGREWLMLHHDTGALLAVTAELQIGGHTPRGANATAVNTSSSAGGVAVNVDGRGRDVGRSARPAAPMATRLGGSCQLRDPPSSSWVAEGGIPSTRKGRGR